MTRDYWEQIEKSLLCFKGKVPSQDFTTDDFSLWLEYATPGELERDILTEKTYNRIHERVSKYEKLNEKIKKLAEEIPYEPECEPKVEFQYLGPLKLKVSL